MWSYGRRSDDSRVLMSSPRSRIVCRWCETSSMGLSNNRTAEVLGRMRKRSGTNLDLFTSHITSIIAKCNIGICWPRILRCLTYQGQKRARDWLTSSGSIHSPFAIHRAINLTTFTCREWRFSAYLCTLHIAAGLYLTLDCYDNASRL